MVQLNRVLRHFVTAATVTLALSSLAQAAWNSCSYEQRQRIAQSGAACAAGSAALCNSSGEYACCKPEPRGDVNENGLADDGTKIVCGSAQPVPSVMAPPATSTPVRPPAATIGNKAPDSVNTGLPQTIRRATLNVCDGAPSAGFKTKCESHAGYQAVNLRLSSGGCMDMCCKGSPNSGYTCISDPDLILDRAAGGNVPGHGSSVIAPTSRSPKSINPPSPTTIQK